ncbi:MAG: hypothetical protein A2Z66_07345 [Chloroflexi bacterium RBG_13_66_10]|jgi:hypothetical protein|nr:MAG: hypothetical protein A2Z66_07345 [Chloroflexi bacterium RBG_13_66_10]
MDETTQWEYRVISLGGGLRGTKDEQMETELNALGDEGWEVVGLTSRENSQRITLVAKRPLTPTARRQRTMPEGSW